MVNEHYASYNSQITVSNGTTHLHSVSTRGASPPKATLVQIDSPSLATTLPVCGGYTMGQPTTTENTRGLQIFRRNPILRSILKNGKVHNSSTEEGLLPTVAQPRSGILKKVASSEQNGGPFVMHTPVKFPLGPTPVVPAVTVSAKSAASIVQFRIDSASSSASGRSNEQSSDRPAMSSTAASHGATVGDASSGRQSLSAASATSATSLQTLSVNHLQVPQPNHSTALLKPTAPMPHMLGAPPLTPSSISSGSSTNLQPAYYTATTTQRISDLRKILNPEVEEKEDPFKKITESIENCDCFEFNLNNAAKMITVLVLLATLILVIRALKGDR